MDPVFTVKCRAHEIGRSIVGPQTDEAWETFQTSRYRKLVASDNIAIELIDSGRQVTETLFVMRHAGEESDVEFSQAGVWASNVFDQIIIENAAGRNVDHIKSRQLEARSEQGAVPFTVANAHISQDLILAAKLFLIRSLGGCLVDVTAKIAPQMPFDRFPFRMEDTDLQPFIKIEGDTDEDSHFNVSLNPRGERVLIEHGEELDVLFDQAQMELNTQCYGPWDHRFNVAELDPDQVGVIRLHAILQDVNTFGLLYKRRLTSGCWVMVGDGHGQARVEYTPLWLLKHGLVRFAYKAGREKDGHVVACEASAGSLSERAGDFIGVMVLTDYAQAILDGEAEFGDYFPKDTASEASPVPANAVPVQGDPGSDVASSLRAALFDRPVQDGKCDPTAGDDVAEGVATG